VASKYAELKAEGRLEPEPVEDQRYQDRVDEKKRAILAGVRQELLETVEPESFEIPTASSAALAEVFSVLRERKDKIKELESETNLALEAVSQLLVDAYEAEDLTSLKTSDRSVSIQHEPVAKVEDPEKFRLWCIREGLESMMSIPWVRANAMTKDRLLAGSPEPDGIKAFMRVKLVLRKS